MFLPVSDIVTVSDVVIVSDVFLPVSDEFVTVNGVFVNVSGVLVSESYVFFPVICLFWHAAVSGVILPVSYVFVCVRNCVTSNRMDMYLRRVGNTSSDTIILYKLFSLNGIRDHKQAVFTI